MQTWDYGWAGYYFVTVCTEGRGCYFGEVIDKQVQRSAIGKLVDKKWNKTPMVRPDINQHMGPFVMMPNHLYGIIRIIMYNQGASGVGDFETVTVRGTTHHAPTNHNPPSYNRFGPQSKNPGSIMRGFKSAATVQARELAPDLGWQSLYYDRMVRNQIAYQRISSYISNNPACWDNDNFNPEFI